MDVEQLFKLLRGGTLQQSHGLWNWLFKFKG